MTAAATGGRGGERRGGLSSRQQRQRHHTTVFVKLKAGLETSTSICARFGDCLTAPPCLFVSNDSVALKPGEMLLYESAKCPHGTHYSIGQPQELQCETCDKIIL